MLSASEIKSLIIKELEKDRGDGDVTSKLLDRDQLHKAQILLKEEGVIAGLPFLADVFGSKVDLQLCEVEGTWCKPGTILADLSGPSYEILSTERTALNLLQHLSGIATYTAKCAREVKDYNCDILDTRKTLPGLRELQKYAVKMGGGKNHRFGLDSQILIKNNHLAFLPIKEAVMRARQMYPEIAIEVEVENLEQLKEALGMGVQRILLDNMPLEIVKQAVKITAGQAYLEASGGIDLSTAQAYAACGVNGISMGALTHSVKSLDISMRVVIA